MNKPVTAGRKLAGETAYRRNKPEENIRRTNPEN